MSLYYSFCYLRIISIDLLLHFFSPVKFMSPCYFERILNMNVCYFIRVEMIATSSHHDLLYPIFHFPILSTYTDLFL